MTAVGGIILIVFGLVPKMSVIVASVPQFVLGGAGVVMFGMVLATGIRILAKVDTSIIRTTPTSSRSVSCCR